MEREREHQRKVTEEGEGEKGERRGGVSNESCVEYCVAQQLQTVSLHTQLLHTVLLAHCCRSTNDGPPNADLENITAVADVEQSSLTIRRRDSPRSAI